MPKPKTVAVERSSTIKELIDKGIIQGVSIDLENMLVARHGTNKRTLRKIVDSQYR